MSAPPVAPQGSWRTLAGAKSERERLPSSVLPIHTRYRRAQVLGLLLIAVLILAATLLRADAHALFPPGWWRF